MCVLTEFLIQLIVKALLIQELIWMHSECETRSFFGLEKVAIFRYYRGLLKARQSGETRNIATYADAGKLYDQTAI